MWDRSSPGIFRQAEHFDFNLKDLKEEKKIFEDIYKSVEKIGGIGSSNSALNLFEKVD